MSSKKSLLLKILLPVGILAGAVALAVVLVTSRPAPERAPAVDAGVLVETAQVTRRRHTLEVRAQGSVVAAREATLQPQVAGRLVWVSDALVPGGVVEQGQLLARIDARDYELAVQERRTAVEQAKAQLAQEQGQQVIARREWELFESETGGSAEDSPLALRKPQLKSAQVTVEAAQARLAQAQLDLKRTRIEAPFNALVREESAEVGLLVSSQTSIATLVGTDEFWVRASIPVSDLEHIQIPGVNANEGSQVVVRQDVGEGSITRHGEVVRLLGDLDPAARTARVLIRVPDPLGLTAQGEQPRGMPLLLDAYVTVLIEAAQARELVEISREALREGNRVWVYDDGKLDVREVDVAWRRPDTVLVATGLETGDDVVTSPIASPVEGMKLRRADDPPPDGTPRRPSTEAPPDSARSEVRDG